MAWIEKLYRTYEHSLQQVGIEDNKGVILLPIAHSTQNAQIEIAIDLKGEWKGARIVEKPRAVTIIPVTEDSGSRSSGITAHPLFDKLCYVAGDYARYVNTEKSEECFQAYVNQLEAWCEAGAHPYVNAIFAYIKKRCMMKDLVEAGILHTDENEMLSEKDKIEGIGQADAFVRFYIQDEQVQGLGEVWKDTAVYENYIKYYLTLQQEEDLDYITGDYMVCSEKQPSKIRHSGDKAKLISANDSSGFTYRGRFGKRNEALSVGYVSSQKAHNALKWLIERQAYRRNGMCIVTWNPKKKELPDWLDDTDDFLYENDFLVQADVGEEYATRINTAIKGRYADIDTIDTDIVVLSLDAATPGRLAVTHFQELVGSEFLKRLQHWHATCGWNMTYKKGRGVITMAPRPEDIARVAFGYEQNGLLHVSDEVMKETVERLIPCILNGSRIPLDIVRAAVCNASRPLAYSAYNNRKILEITCALIYKSYQDREEGKWNTMSLDRTRTERDYLYGRMMAVAHKVEYDTFSETDRGKRETLVNRYRTRMVRKPGITWTDINNRLVPYWRKLHPSRQVRYEKEMQEIYDLFQADEYNSNKSLGAEYLLGFACELSALWDYQKEKEEDGGNENE